MALIPIVLLLLDGIARQRGTIEWRGLRLSFAQAAEGATSGAVVPANATPGTELLDSGMHSLLRTARAASRNRIIVVDLTDGTSWWETRLLMVLSVASAQPGEHAIVFLAERGQRGHLFLGWAHADILRERLLDSRPHLRLAYEAAAKDAIRGAASLPLLPPNEPTTGPQAAIDEPRALGDPDARNLAQHIQRLEASTGAVPGRYPLTAATVIDWFYPVLVTETVERNATQELWVKAVLGTDARYIAVTDGQVYVGLLSRAQAVNSLLDGLLKR
ncbi:hypothetical protein [Arthrobacter sp. OV608]|uniref:hypothetical protein n=1 Tax=Arthrobacter sp. OV608 TaxID=1882768 RepID=UPI00111396E4|nr:hypothetical protein [Arthrobacter sp. OV608]